MGFIERNKEILCLKSRVMNHFLITVDKLVTIYALITFIVHFPIGGQPK